MLSQMLGRCRFLDLSGSDLKAEPSMTKSTRTRTRTERERERDTLEIQGNHRTSQTKTRAAYVQRRRGHRFRYCPVRTPGVGATPSMALNKAARRIHKKNPSSWFRSSCRVSPKHSERELYMYDVTMVKDPKPQVCDFRVDIRSHQDGTQKDSLKKVRVVQASDQPVTSTSQARVSRTPTLPISSTCLCVHPVQTLFRSLSLDHPLKIYDLIVVRTEWKVTSRETRRSARAFVRSMTPLTLAAREHRHPAREGACYEEEGRQGQRRR
jgi:hypothetical protein